MKKHRRSDPLFRLQHGQRRFASVPIRPTIRIRFTKTKFGLTRLDLSFATYALLVGLLVFGLIAAMLNWDKLLFFRWPLHYGMMGTRKTAKYSILTCWLTCCMGGLVMILPSVLELSPNGDCATVGISTKLYLIYTSAFCILPVLSSAVVSIYLAHLVSSMRRNCPILFCIVRRLQHPTTFESYGLHFHHYRLDFSGIDTISRFQQSAIVLRSYLVRRPEHFGHRALVGVYFYLSISFQSVNQRFIVVDEIRPV